MENIIFDLTNINYKYKGVLFAELDNAQIDKEIGNPFPTPKDYLAGIMAIIWVDKKGIWNFKMRIKFPSGSKQVVNKIYDKEFKKGIKVNETYILQDLYKFPMVNKTWLSNPEETGDGILKLIENADMIESINIIS